MFSDAIVPLFAAITSVSLLIALLFHGATRHILRGLMRKSSRSSCPPISVLKPLTGIDERLYENLQCIAQQDYPDFEIIFGVETPQDPACALVRRLQRAYPQTQIRLVVGGPKIGVNPKVSNLANMTAVALHDYLLVSDANVRVGHDYLKSVSASLDSDVGLVCNVIIGNDAESLGAVCEDLHLNTFITPAVCAAFAFAKHPCVVGKSMLLRQEHLQRLGGWRAVANVLAEDYVVGQMTYRAGLRVVLSPYVIHAVHQHRRLWAFVERHVRWSQMRWRLAPAAYAGELLLNTAPWAWGWGGIAMMHGQHAQAICAAGSWCAKMVLDLRLHAYLTQRPVTLMHAIGLALKDAMLPAVWLLGILCRSVTWRGHSMRIGRGSVVRACPGMGLDVPPLPRHSA